MNDAPTLPTACGSLPSEGAAAPAARRSRFRGPCLGRFSVDTAMTPTLPTSCGSLPPGGALRLRPGEAGSVALAGVEFLWTLL